MGLLISRGRLYLEPFSDADGCRLKVVRAQSG
jgi:hypothetical protein